MLASLQVFFITGLGLRLLPPPVPGQPPRRVRFRLFLLRGTIRQVSSSNPLSFPPVCGSIYETYPGSRYSFDSYEFPTCFSAEAAEDTTGSILLPDVREAARLLRIELLDSVADVCTPMIFHSFGFRNLWRDESPEVPFRRLSLDGFCTQVQVTDLRVNAELPWGNTLLSTFERAFQFHGPRPLCGRRPKPNEAPQPADFRWRDYASVWQRVQSFARGLLTRMERVGVSADGGVAIMAQNCEEWLVACFACWHLGRAVVAVATTTAERQLSAVLQQGQAEVLISDCFHGSTAAHPLLKLVIRCGGTVPSFLRLFRLMFGRIWRQYWRRHRRLNQV